MKRKANNYRKTFRKQSTLRRMIAISCLVPVAGFAQDFTLSEPAESASDPEKRQELMEVGSEVEAGVGYNSDDSFRFGKYTGLNEEGAFGVLNVDINKRGPYDGESAGYSRIKGQDLGLDSRSAEFETGRQGDYRAYVEYNQIPYYNSDSASTPFNGAGGDVLTLPGNWRAAGNTGGMSLLSSSLKEFDIEHDRKRIAAGFDKILNSRWSFNTRVQHESKEGTKTIGGVIGNTGGNPRAAILPEPIDYNETKLDAELNYATPKQQFQLGYHVSLFSNDQDSLLWRNPYSAIGGWDPSAGYPGGQGRLALPPDNEYHQITAAYGNNLSDKTRLNADFAYGRMTQDEDFQSYSVNQVLRGSIVNPLPRDSLDGEIENMLFNLQLSSRPSPKMHWRGQLRYEDRDNNTPRDAYNYIGGDSQRQDASLAGGRIRFNEPYSREELKISFDGGYQLGDRTEITGGLEHRNTDRTYTEREEAKDDILRLGLKSHASDKATWLLRYERSDRDGSTYIGEEPFVSSNTPQAVAATAGGWENLPGLRKFYLADRVRDKVNFLFNYMPAERWNVGFGANYITDDYRASEFGLTGSDIEQYTVDASYMPTFETSIYGFASLEKLDSVQDGRAFRGGGSKLSQASDPRQNWSARHRDDVDTIGFGFQHELMDSRLNIGADYAYSSSTGRIDVSTGSGIDSEPVPNLKTKLHTFNLYGDYEIKRDLILRLSYWYEKYDTDDWSIDGVAPNELSNVITLGDVSPDYDNHVIALSVRYRFR